MRDHGLKRQARAVAAILLATLTLAPTVILAGDSDLHRDRDRDRDRDFAVIRAQVVTGFNRLLGKPITDFGAPLGTAGFTNVAMYNPAGSEPILLTPRTSRFAVLATYVDPAFLAIIGRTPADVDPQTINVPINDVAVNVSPAGDVRIPLRGHFEAGQSEPSLAEPTSVITLGEWLKASGSATIRCHGGRARVNLEFNRLTPRRLYSVWAILGQPNGPPMALPLGGVPNAVITDQHGDATFDRVLNFCPMRNVPGQDPLIVIDIVMHSDQQLWGALPDLPLVGLYTGTINHNHLEFQIRGRAVR